MSIWLQTSSLIQWFIWNVYISLTKIAKHAEGNKLKMIKRYQQEPAGMRWQRTQQNHRRCSEASQRSTIGKPLRCSCLPTSNPARLAPCTWPDRNSAGTPWSNLRAQLRILRRHRQGRNRGSPYWDRASRRSSHRSRAERCPSQLDSGRHFRDRNTCWYSLERKTTD